VTTPTFPPDVVTGIESTCYWCDQEIRQIHDGSSGIEDWEAMDRKGEPTGGFGCDGSPISTDDGTGSHLPTEDVRSYTAAAAVALEITAPGLDAYRQYIERNLERIERGGWTPVCFAEWQGSEEATISRAERATA
jgi:hypothetical protein